MIKLFGKPIRVNKTAQDTQTQDVGANLFVGNLDPELDEKLLYDTFSAFGVIVGTPKVMRDPDTGNSRGFGFVSYDSFEAADAAIEAMHGQFLCNRPVSVTFAYKKDTRGERHGTPAERMLAASINAEKKTAVHRPHTMFAAGPAGQSAGPRGGAGLTGRGGGSRRQRGGRCGCCRDGDRRYRSRFGRTGSRRIFTLSVLRFTFRYPLLRCLKLA